MNSQSDSRLVSLFESFSGIASIIIFLVGCIVLIGWAFNITILKSLSPNLVAMKANTAINFSLIGVSLWFLQTKRVNKKTRYVAQLCAFVVALVGLLSLCEYLFNCNFGIDQLLFKEPPGAVGTSHPGRMAPNTAVNFSIIGIALLLLDVESRGGYRPAQFLISIEGIISSLALVGYIYGLLFLYRVIPSYTQMALHTAIAFNLVFVGVLFARPDRGLMAILTSGNIGGRLLRRSLFVVICVPLILGWLMLVGEQKGFYGSVFALLLFALISIIVFAILIWVYAKLLDVSDGKRKQMEEELQKAKELAEHANRSKSTFLTNMSHELRTPLNSVIGFAEVLKDKKFGTISEKQEKYVENILVSGNHLLSLINDILDISKVESGKMELALSEFSFPQVLENIKIILKELALKKNISIETFVAPDVSIITADERKIKQIMYNLLSNAIKFTPEDGKVNISARIKEKELQVRVSDTGIGIRQEDVGKLFQPFQQIDSEHTHQYKGTGLGLSLSKNLVELHGGQIWCESEYRKGSTFIFTIPLKRE